VKPNAPAIGVNGDKAMRRRGVALMGVVALVSGCSLQPVYERPAPPIAGTYPTGAAYKSSTGESGSATAPPSIWVGAIF
jgi:hypothetical protein